VRFDSQSLFHHRKRTGPKLIWFFPVWHFHLDQSESGGNPSRAERAMAVAVLYPEPDDCFD